MPSLYLKLAAGVAFLALLGGIWWHGYQTADEARTQAFNAAMTQQIAIAAENQYEAARQLAQVEAEHERWKEGFIEMATLTKKEVIRYVQGPSKKCEVSPELERAYDAVISLHDAAVPADDLPASSRTTGEPVESSAGGLQDAPGNPEQPIDDSVMLEAYSDVLMEYSSLRSTYESLVNWVRVSYALQTEGAGR